MRERACEPSLSPGTPTTRSGSDTGRSAITFSDSPYVHLFGHRNWEDVRTAIHDRLRRRFPGAGSERLADATSVAMLDLIDYWVELPSSVDLSNPERTFWFAVRRGVWKGTESLARSMWESTQEDSFQSEAYEEPRSESWPELDYIESADLAAAVNAWKGLRPSRASWLNGYLRGEPAEAEGASLGITQQAMSKRRIAAIGELRQMVLA